MGSIRPIVEIKDLGNDKAEIVRYNLDGTVHDTILTKYSLAVKAFAMINSDRREMEQVEKNSKLTGEIIKGYELY